MADMADTVVMSASCVDCGAAIVAAQYGIWDGRKVCYACCAKRDAAYMRERGSALLYLDTSLTYQTIHGAAGWRVTNWPGSLVISVDRSRQGKHNIAGVRYDVWFAFEGQQWHGVTYGDNTQLCHCKRINSRHSTT